MSLWGNNDNVTSAGLITQFDYDNKIVYNTKYVKIGILDKDQEIVFD